MLQLTVSVLLVLLPMTAYAVDYGVDCSFPIHHKNQWSCGDLLGNRSQFYQDFMAGCHAYYGPKQAKRCDSTEADRLEMSYRQPMSMVNYTSAGYKKVRAPKLLYDMLLNHWETNKHAKTQEVWFMGNTYTNHWESPTYMVGVEDSKLRGGGYSLKERLWEAVRETIEEWTGMEQKPTSMYGIREYTANALLSPHVDRLPLVSSCIVNVAQDLDEPWPLEIYDREGKGTFMYCLLLHVFTVNRSVLILAISFNSRECNNGTG
jgi:prolyl 4-hydroxylase